MRAVVDDFVVEDFGENCLYFGNFCKNTFIWNANSRLLGIEKLV